MGEDGGEEIKYIYKFIYFLDFSLDKIKVGTQGFLMMRISR